MNECHKKSGDRASSEVSYPLPRLLFPCIKLPKISGLADVHDNLDWVLQRTENIPYIDGETINPRLKRRGAPTKQRNYLADAFDLYNLKGKPFKFSFVCQILVAHLQHLLGLKGKSRQKKTNWLRSYTIEGKNLQAAIREMAREHMEHLTFKRTVSMNDMKLWLQGKTYYEGPDTDFISSLRVNIVRVLCVLKCIDIDRQYENDFNVKSSGTLCGSIFRTYLLKTMWEEMRFPIITEDEFEDIMKKA